MNKGRVGGGRRGYLDTKKEKTPYWPAHRGSASHAVSCALLYRHGLGHLGSHFYMGLRTMHSSAGAQPRMWDRVSAGPCFSVCMEHGGCAALAATAAAHPAPPPG
jgi:hypothetical protein